MKKTILITTILFTTVTVMTISCNKNNACFDKAFFQQHKNDICSEDCPGVVGCDGKTYCNECMANRNGIRIK